MAEAADDVVAEWRVRDLEGDDGFGRVQIATPTSPTVSEISSPVTGQREVTPAVLPSSSGRNSGSHAHHAESAPPSTCARSLPISITLRP
jgi:hypothetical protein